MSAGKTGRWLAIGACVVVAATVAAAILVMGSPSAQRVEKLDHKRVEDLARIDRFVDSYVERTSTLPPDLGALAREPGVRVSITDPVDGSPYGYEVTGVRSFRLCAVFTTDTGKTLEDLPGWPGDEWTHGVGRRCFERKAKKSQTGQGE